MEGKKMEMKRRGGEGKREDEKEKENGKQK